MYALWYFNGKFNIFEYILLNKTCQSYSWVTLSDIITTHEIYISGDISTFLAHNVNCKVTTKTPNANPCVLGIKSGSDHVLHGIVVWCRAVVTQTWIVCFPVNLLANPVCEQLWFTLISSNSTTAVSGPVVYKEHPITDAVFTTLDYSGCSVSLILVSGVQDRDQSDIDVHV